MAYWCWDVSTSDSFNGSIEIVESFTLDYLSADLTTNTEGWETTLDDDETKQCICKDVIGVEKL